MKLHIPFILITLVILSACSSSEFIPHEGDLLFQVSDISAMSDAITDATAQHDSIKYDHVAIFTLDQGKPYVIEASSKHGVVRTTWDKFVASSKQINGKPGIVVMRINEKEVSIAKAISRAKNHLGEEYDWSFLPDNGKMYCSELVYDAFLDENGSPIFTENPMNFRDAKGEMPAFWITLFQKLGEPIPEGVLGTNPNDMSKEAILTEVCRCF